MGYPAGLLDYFFRGELGVKVIPVFTGNVLGGLSLEVRNYTSTREPLSNGYFVLGYNFTRKSDGARFYGAIPSVISMNNLGVAQLPYGKNADGSDNDNKIVIFFTSFPHSITVEEYPSATFSLAYFGELGAEKPLVSPIGTAMSLGAVIGKVFKGGKILFNEEWDNGLTGNYQWCHGVNEPDSINISNFIEEGDLIKDNNRSSDYLKAHLNQTLLSANFSQCNTDNTLPITITRDTHLQFKIDAMTITNPPVSGDGSVTQYQGLWLNFSGGVSLQLSLPGQFLTYPSTGNYTFSPGGSTSGNIYDMLRQVGLPVSEPLTLRSINLVQQLLQHDIENGDCNQHMEMDFIRIVDAKPIE
ncbi:MAG: hypothetical protein WC291_01115 [Thermodesulfovibrionales bacterium]